MDVSNFSLCTDLIGDAYLQGFDPIRVCLRLRTALRNDEVMSVGYRVVKYLDDERRAEPLPHFQLTRIPASFWRSVPRLIDPDLGGIWYSDVRGVHKSLWWSTANWFEGVFQNCAPLDDWSGSAIEEYRGVRLHAKQARIAIARLRGISPPSGRGRRRGSSLYSHETPLYEEGARLVTRGGLTVNGAATQLASRATGGATLDSIIKRLSRGISGILKAEALDNN